MNVTPKIEKEIIYTISFNEISRNIDLYYLLRVYFYNKIFVILIENEMKKETFNRYN